MPIKIYKRQNKDSKAKDTIWISVWELQCPVIIDAMGKEEKGIEDGGAAGRKESLERERLNPHVEEMPWRQGRSRRMSPEHH